MMTDAHCHVVRGASRHFLCDPCDTSSLDIGDVRFVGTHPWLHETFDADALRMRLVANPRLGVGEIGLDRLRTREMPQHMREVFEAQLEIAAEFRRPVALHGAKCWGEVVKAIKAAWRRIAGESAGRGFAAFLFHGFSRSDGLLPDIVALNGYVSIGPAILNDHAVNYRELARKIPADRLLVESDATAATAVSVPSVEDVAVKLAELRDTPAETMAAQLEANADAFAGCLLRRSV